MGDFSRTVSESLGDFLQKWGIPAIPRPRINTEPAVYKIFFPNHLLLSHITIVEATDRVERGMNPVAMTIVVPQKEYWLSRGSNQRHPVLKSSSLPTELWTWPTALLITVVILPGSKDCVAPCFEYLMKFTLYQTTTVFRGRNRSYSNIKIWSKKDREHSGKRKKCWFPCIFFFSDSALRRLLSSC